MKEKRKQYYKEKLFKEKKRVESLIDKIKEFEPIKSDSELSSELSLYDNHPADTGQQFYDKAKGAALQKNEIEILNAIDDSLDDIKHGKYGICRACGKQIPDERLEVIPYAKYCIECKRAQCNSMPPDSHNRPPEEEVIEEPFGYGNNDNSTSIPFDAEDSYQGVERFNEMENIYEFNDYDEDDEHIGIVEEVDKISNQQYKDQLPD
ncbi:general stress protein [Clostridium novyi B str. ATCC 27606]|uniref:General stress protein n=2 Tax=Clostridium TaxID=1485 RepID=A0AA40ISW9_CLONO|nr:MULTISPECIES: TraR/DksA C4-type zinc finger protein [Clostridium]KEI13136.1 general stress protein [Clostridium novyi B str. NCTC 9691]KEI14346.1 general stress protein [Clostridium novyi B str. ATCC 27606]KEI16019.1 general stress protein [Clostridium haemolyticum NCTC 9693]KGM99722.1 general stress protein [Clostridium haemolyticum NCTC 8350]CAG7840991.1 RNA polymerase-binding transcription factor DksA [Clostridium haemolyticum]